MDTQVKKQSLIPTVKLSDIRTGRINLTEEEKRARKAESEARINKEIEERTVYEKEWCALYDWTVQSGYMPSDPEYTVKKEKGILPAGYVYDRLLQAGAFETDWIGEDWKEYKRRFGRPEDIDTKSLSFKLMMRDAGLTDEEPAQTRTQPQPTVAHSLTQPQPTAEAEADKPQPSPEEEMVKAEKELLKEEEEAMLKEDNELRALLERELAREIKLREKCNFTKDYTDIFRVRTFNEMLMESSKRPDPIGLWKSLWVEGEICCLFADTNIGKTIYAMQIAAEIAKKRKILVFDFEMSDKQHEKRCRDKNKKLHFFNENLLQAELLLQKVPSGEELEEIIVPAMEQTCTLHETDIMIVDNIGWLCNNSADGELAGKLMAKLMDLRNRRGFSIMVIGHTNKRDMTKPITQNDLAGSKKLMNYFDSAFCIQKSQTDPSIRFIKQLKTRNSDFEYGEENVILCEITDEGGYLHFAEKGYATESSLLRQPDDKDVAALKKRVLLLSGQGLSNRQIADKLSLSYSKVQRIISKAKGNESDTGDSVIH